MTFWNIIFNKNRQISNIRGITSKNPKYNDTSQKQLMIS